MRPVSASLIVPSPLSVNRTARQALVSKVQLAAHCNTPYANPWVTQVAPFRLSASHCSAASRKPLPQPTAGPPPSAAATVSVCRSVTALKAGAVGAPSRHATPFDAHQHFG